MSTLVERARAMDRIHPMPSDHPAGCHDDGLYGDMADALEWAEAHLSKAERLAEAVDKWDHTTIGTRSEAAAERKMLAELAAFRAPDATETEAERASAGGPVRWKT